MDGAIRHKILDEISRTLKMVCGWVFQHDNDPDFATNATKERLIKQHTEVMEWPSWILDLKPTQNLRELEFEVAKWQPRIVQD